MKVEKTPAARNTLQSRQQSSSHLDKSPVKKQRVMFYPKSKQKMIPTLSLDTIVQLFQWWERTINEFALRDIDQENHAELRNPIHQRQLQRKLEDSRTLRICLILLQAERDEQPPYSLRRLADAMGGNKEDMEKNKLMQSQIKTILKGPVAYGLLNYY